MIVALSLALCFWFATRSIWSALPNSPTLHLWIRPRFCLFNVISFCPVTLPSNSKRELKLFSFFFLFTREFMYSTAALSLNQSTKTNGRHTVCYIFASLQVSLLLMRFSSVHLSNFVNLFSLSRFRSLLHCIRQPQRREISFSFALIRSLVSFAYPPN